MYVHVKHALRGAMSQVCGGGFEREVKVKAVVCDLYPMNVSHLKFNALCLLLL
jgi:hypothetical protein